MSARNVFVTGASGKLGLRITSLLVARGDHVSGLARSAASAAKVEKVGAKAVTGTTTDLDLLKTEAAKADVVIHCAFNHDIAFTDAKRACAEDRDAIQALVAGLKANHGGQREKVFLYTSGTFGNEGTDEDCKKRPNEHMPRHLSEDLTIQAASANLRSVNVRLAPIVHERESVHMFLENMITAAKKTGISGYIDAHNVWPSAHYDDVAQLMVLAIDKAPSGKTLHAVAEEGVSTKDLAAWIGEELSMPVQQVAQDKALEHFGFVGMLLGFNNLTTSEKTKQWTGWKPTSPTLLVEMRKRGLKEYA